MPGLVNSSCAIPQVTTLSTTGETTIITAGSAGVYNNPVSWQFTNASATAVTVTIKDSTGGTTRFIYDLAANGGIVVCFPTPVVQSKSAANWTATLSAGSITVDASCQYVQSNL
jgi:hypothetical protein